MDVFDLSAPLELHEAVALLEKYADTPMDIADATLVLLAETLDARDVLTLDRRGFAAYRTGKGRAMRVIADAG
jgi:predicted nucleic acid-binding protein